MTTTDPSTSIRPIARTGPALLAALALLASGCTGALSGRGESSPTTVAREAVTAWPEDDSVAETVSPVHPEVTLGIRPLLREANGTTTLLVEVRNDGSENTDIEEIFGSAGLRATSIIDPVSRVRSGALASDDGPRCLCTATDSVVEPGGSAVAAVAFGDVAPVVTEVRVTLPEWRPVDSVPVRDVAFAAEAGAETAAEDDPDRQITVQGVWRTPDGLVVRVEDRNATAEVLDDFELSAASSLAVVDPKTLRTGSVRLTAEDRSPVIEDRPDDLAPGESITRDVLVAEPAGRPETVLVRIPGARRTLPITVQENDPSSDLSIPALAAPESSVLESSSRAERSPLVELADPGSDAPTDPGPIVDLPEAGEPLVSEAEPDWAVAGRAVVRAGEDRSVVYLDVQRGDARFTWPDGLDGGLRDLAVLDPERNERLGVLDGGRPDGSSSAVGVPENGTRTVHVAVAPVDEASSTVTIDVPSFGQLTGVPVIDGPDVADGDDEVLASLPDDQTGRLRIDVLDLGRLADDGGVLLRARRVNVSAPDAWSPTEDLCEASLSDPDTGRRFEPLPPCESTEWTRELGAGEGLVQEVRFADLPEDVDRLVLEVEGWLGSAPIELADEVAPWYLDLPRRAEAPEGDTLVASVGFADDLQTERRDGDEVDLDLDTDVLFAFGSADLAPGAVARLEGIGDRLAGDVSGTVSVIGHTDSVGEEAANQTLSEQRAQAVADVLQPALGDAVTLEAEGRGETDPVAANEIDGRDDPDGRSRNRRVTITYRG